MRWSNVTKDKPCPVCGRPNANHRSKWCIVSPDGDAAICPFTPEGAKKYIEESGYLHVFKRRSIKTYTRERIPAAQKQSQRRVVNWIVLQKFYHNRLTPSRLIRLSGQLDIHPSILLCLGIGYEGNNTWTFPMYNDTERIIGIRKRNCTGKTAVFGSRNGLFMVTSPQPVNENILVVCEGPTDTAKALALGYYAIGKASCNTCETLIERYLYGKAIRDLFSSVGFKKFSTVVMADNDEVGIHYANRLAKRIGAKVILPARGKDLREWNPTKKEFTEVIQCRTK